MVKVRLPANEPSGSALEAEVDDGVQRYASHRQFGEVVRQLGLVVRETTELPVYVTFGVVEEYEDREGPRSYRRTIRVCYPSLAPMPQQASQQNRSWWKRLVD